MFRNILVATDGSALSAQAVTAGVKLAKSVGAKVTGFYAAPQALAPFYPEGALATPYGLVGEYVPAPELDQRIETMARATLEVIKREAEAAQVPYALKYVRNDFPATAIVAEAIDSGCDCIVMASHGRGSVTSLLLGSETLKVLTHSKIPVLVVR